MASRNNNSKEGPGRTSSQGRNEASGGEQPAVSPDNGKSSGKNSAGISRGGSSTRTASSKGAAKTTKKTSVPAEKATKRKR